MPWLSSLWLAAACAAQSSSAPLQGYVVRVDSPSVYLDFGQGSGAEPGQGFSVYAEGAELKHPVSGESLGPMETKLAEGSLKEIFPLYSVGLLASVSGEIKPGLRARLGPKPLAAATAAPTPQPGPSQPGGVPVRLPRWKSPAFDFSVTGMAVADFKGDGSLQVALSEPRLARLFPYPPQDNKPLAEFKHPGVAPRLLSLEAADSNQNGRAELFVSLYNETFGRMETLILELESGASGLRWKQLAEIPWLVRSHQDGEGKRVLAMQQLSEDSTFPFSAIYPLAYKDGKYAAGRPAIRHKRVEWIYGFTTAALDGAAPAVLYLTSTRLLRVQFPKGYWKTREAYGQTPNRVRWQGRLLEFHPPIAVDYDEAKKSSLYVVRNISMMGSLSEPFGLFNSAEIHRKTWGGVGLESSWKADLGGYSTAIALVSPRPGARELAVAVTGTSGKSALWIFDP